MQLHLHMWPREVSMRRYWMNVAMPQSIYNRESPVVGASNLSRVPQRNGSRNLGILSFI